MILNYITLYYMCYKSIIYIPKLSALLKAADNKIEKTNIKK